MKTPEIAIQEERGVYLLSLLLKAENPKWGETGTPLAKETTDYFKDHPVNQNIVNAVRKLHEQGVDEETLYNLALTFQHPEREESVFDMAAKHKPHVSNPHEVQQKLFALLESIDQAFLTSPLAAKFEAQFAEDKNGRLEKLEETRRRITEIIGFYRPYSATTNVQRLIFMPTNPLHRVNSGASFSVFPGEQIIMSHINNMDNQDHEFCHGIINPIVDKLALKLTEDQKERISRFAGKKLKQDYGEGFYSLLCEEFIRTYVDVFRKREEPHTYEDFAKKVSGISGDQLRQYLSQSKSLKARCDELGIASMDDFRNKSQEYFELFEKNHLRDLIFELYQEYLNRPDKEAENFEEFVLREFAARL